VTAVADDESAVVSGGAPAEGADVTDGTADQDFVSQAEQAATEEPSEGSVAAGNEAVANAPAVDAASTGSSPAVDGDQPSQAEQAATEEPAEGSVKSAEQQ